jgi:hypothetical protein
METETGSLSPGLDGHGLGLVIGARDNDKHGSSSHFFKRGGTLFSIVDWPAIAF